MHTITYNNELIDIRKINTHLKTLSDISEYNDQVIERIKKNKTKNVIYARVSTKTQYNNAETFISSIPLQILRCLNFAPDAEVILEIGSAYNKVQPELFELLNEVEHNCTLLVNTADRLTRTIKTYVKICNEYKNFTIYSVSDALYGNDPAFAKKVEEGRIESKRISDRLKQYAEHCKNEGILRHNEIIPYGIYYDYVKKSNGKRLKKLVDDSKTKKIYNLRKLMDKHGANHIKFTYKNIKNETSNFASKVRANYDPDIDINKVTLKSNPRFYRYYSKLELLKLNSNFDRMEI